MIQLRLLGHPALEGAPGSEASVLLSQPKRLALLAYLAAAGKSLRPRDRVLGALWPDQPEERARHSLNQGLHVLRRELGLDAVVTRGELLGLDPHIVRCDVVAFREALRAGERGRALELYQGPLLDGCFLADAPEFEQWLESTRTELHAHAAEAASRLAEDAAARARPEAVNLARRAAELLPYDEAAASRLITLLDRDGKSSAALAVYEAFARRLRSELELEPSAKVRGLVDKIRTRPAPPISAPVASTPPPPPISSTGTPAHRRSRRVPIAVLTIALGAVTLWSLISRGRVLRAAMPVEAAALGRVAVLPFAVQGDLTRRDSLGRDLVELLGSRLDGAGALRVVPADSVLQAVDRSGGRSGPGMPAGSVIEGSLTRSGGTIHIRALWRRSLDHSLIAEATTEGATDQLFGLLDRLAFQLLAQAQAGPRHALTRTAALSTTSLPALKSYLAGEHAFAEGRFTAASQAFEQATAIDSSFALAHYRLGVAALWAEDYPLAALDAGSRALRHSAGLSDRDRRLLEGFDAWRRGDRDNASSRYLSILASDHDNLEAWFQLGETLFHYNPVWGQPVAEARDAFRQVIRLDPDHWGAIWHLAMLDALEGQTSELDRHLAHLVHLGPNTDYALEIAALRACAHRDGVALSRLSDALRSAGEGRVYDMTWRCAVYARDLDGAEMLARLLLERRTVRFAEVQGRFVLANLDMARGWRRRAFAQLDSLKSISPLMALLGRTSFELLPLPRDSSNELEILRRDWNNWRGPASEVRGTISLARIEAELGHRAAAELLAARLDSTADEAGSQGLLHAQAQEARAVLAVQAGDQARALRELEDLPPVVWFGLMVSSPLESRVSGRFLLAETLAAAGRPQEALRWYGSLGELSTYDLVYVPLAHLRRAELYAQLADTAATAEEYARFLELWKDADPELQPIVTRARERLTRLSAHR